MDPDAATSRSLDASPDDLFAGGGETGALLRAVDWSATPLGPPAEWSQSLKTCVRIMLTSRQPIWVGWGPELIYMYNDAYMPIIGGRHPWALGEPIERVWTEIWPVIEPMLSQAMSGTEGTYVEAQLLIMERHGYEEETYYTFSYSPVPDDSGGVGGIICANTDDTQRVIGERQMDLLRQLAADTAGARTVEDACERAVAALATDPRDVPFALLYLEDADDRTVLRLEGAVGLTAGHRLAPRTLAGSGEGAAPPWWAPGRPGDVAVVGLEEHEDLPREPWSRAPERVAVVPVASSGETGRAGVLVAGLNPFRQWDEEYEGFLTLVAGQVSGAVGNAEAHQEERKRAQILAELDEAKTTFFSNVSHEFRTPLTLMLGPLDGLLSGGGPDLAAPVRDELEMMRRNALRLLRLVNTLLDFSRMEAGRTRAEFRPTDLGRFTAELASTFRSTMERAGLDYVVDTGGLYYPVYVDHDMWEKIVLNLVSNAFKFTLEGSVAVRLVPTDDAVVLEVADTGSGIPEDELPYLFERFHRVEGAAGRTHEGTGIGLALVDELVKLHGGSIDVESEEGRGSTFRVAMRRGRAHLPADRVGEQPGGASVEGASAFVAEADRWIDGAAAAAWSEGEVETVAPAEAAAGPPATVVLADDNADMREYVARLLRGRGHRVVEAGDGQEAVDAVRREGPELLISDVMMPRVDGFGALAALRGDPDTRSVPVILLSARAGEESRIEGLGAGADDYLVKPFSARELMARVDAQLALGRLRREATRALRESEARFRLMADHAPVMIWITEPDGTCTYLNQRWYEFTGQTPETGRGFGWLDAVHPGDRERSGQIFLEANAAQRPFRLEYRLRRADGEYRWAIDAAAPRFTDDGDFLGYVGSVVEIHERKQAEEERERLLEEARRARDEAEEANQAKSTFLTTMSHELRTPLNAVLGYTEILGLGIPGPVTDAQTTQLGRIRASAEHLLTLINDILDLAKVEAGQLEVEREAVPARRSVEEAMAVVEPLTAPATVDLAVEGALPDDLAFRGDAARARQVLVNLLANGVKFTEAGGRVRVSVGTADEGPRGQLADAGWVVFRVDDTGLGIEEDRLERIFEPFVQLDPHLTRSQPGTGLGLTISRHLARLMDGDVTVESEPGVGSTFRLWLPRLLP